MNRAPNMTPATPQPAEYARARSRLLRTIRETLEGDERFPAAWLTGSHGRNEADEFSDLDITVVVAEPYAAALCSQDAAAGPGAAPEREALVAQFGKADLILENKANAPEGGAYTFVLYAEDALAVDWTFVPASAARRPQASVLLFDRAGIPLESPAEADREAVRDLVANQIAYFWLMCVVTVKFILRGDGVRVNAYLDVLERTLRQVERLLTGEADRWQRDALIELQVEPHEQIAAVRSACRRMQNLVPKAVEMGGKVPFNPNTTVERLLEMAEDVTGRQGGSP